MTPSLPSLDGERAEPLAMNERTNNVSYRTYALLSGQRGKKLWFLKVLFVVRNQAVEVPPPAVAARRRLGVDGGRRRPSLAHREPVLVEVAQESQLVGRVDQRLGVRRPGDRDAVHVPHVQGFGEHLDAEVAVHRRVARVLGHVPQKVRGVDARLLHEIALALVELRRDVPQVVGGEVRTLEEGVERVDAAEQGDLLLVVQRTHRGGRPLERRT